MRPIFTHHRFSAALAVLLAGALCVSWPAPAGAAPASAGDVTAEAGTGTIRGRVTLPTHVPLPEPRSVANTTDPESCGEVMALRELVVSERRELAHVIVALTDVGDEIIPRPDSGEDAGRLLDNEDCRFRPRVLTVRSGEALRIRNSDPLLHTVHLYGPEELNVALPRAGMEVRRRLTRPGIYQVRCDLHGWMQAFVRVDPHPFHAVTGADGAFVIRDLPAGTYTLEAWHERLGFLRREVRVEAGASTPVDLTYPASTVHPDGKEPP